MRFIDNMIIKIHTCKNAREIINHRFYSFHLKYVQLSVNLIYSNCKVITYVTFCGNEFYK